MRPAAFALLVLAALLVGGAAGGAVGYRIPARSPLTDPESGGATRLLGAVMGEGMINEAYESDRREWMGGGIVAGALLGLASAALIGSYSLRYRSGERRREGETR